jgi:hypothetical protein
LLGHHSLDTVMIYTIPSCQVVEKPPRAVGVVLGGLVLQLGGQQRIRHQVQLPH